ncbi:MAG: TIGR04255 family protein [Deltaproteobacteria bacterium]|nr:TIGR04255 family protein [Deltaproteobacteria bacterium]
MAKELKNKPLVEAIFEVRWKLQGAPPAPVIDPHYKLLLGRLFDRFLQDYPEHEQLPAASIPDDFVGHIIQHRFRVAANKWPLVQVGPGIFSVNSTGDYIWPVFRLRVVTALEKLYDAHPKVTDLKLTNIILRYIDAENFDYMSENAFDFLRDMLKLNISLPVNLFSGTEVENRPTGLLSQCSFKCRKPKGIVTIRFATGQKNNVPAIVWETIVESATDDLPNMPKDFTDWIDAAHQITDNWFFEMIKGELERRYSGE